MCYEKFEKNVVMSEGINFEQMPARLFEIDNNILHIIQERFQIPEHINFEFYHFTNHRYSFMSMCVYLLDSKINLITPATHFSHLSISFILRSQRTQNDLITQRLRKQTILKQTDTFNNHFFLVSFLR